MDSSRWISELPNHPIFKSDEVKTKFLSLDASKNGAHDGHARLTASSPRRSTKMCFRGPDIILAVGKELRIATFGHDIKNSGATGTFKVRHHLLTYIFKLTPLSTPRRYTHRTSSSRYTRSHFLPEAKCLPSPASIKWL